MSTNQVTFKKLCRDVCQQMEQFIPKARLLFQAPEKTQTGGWYAELAELSTNNVALRAHLWWDCFSGYATRRLWYGLWHRYGLMRKALPKFIELDTHAMTRANGYQHLDPPLSRELFGTPIRERYPPKDTYYGIYNASTRPFMSLNAAEIAGRICALYAHMAGSPRELREYSEYDALRKGTNPTIIRQRHKSMNNALARLCITAKLHAEGQQSDNCFDALILAYRESRDLLIEIKADSSRPCLRLAVGQLLDYRRQLPRHDFTEMAVLLENEPADDDRAFLKEAHVLPLWFEDNRRRITGAWKLP